MTTATETGNGPLQARRALWASGVFYVLIAFEFFYMASPFAAYFYAVYGPGLDWLQVSGTTSWLIQFFMPHLVEETRSVLIDGHESVGVVLSVGGLAGFALGAIQIYRAKLRREEAVMGGLYRHIRHPQYLALIVASLGMLLIWPRYLVLMLTVTVVFIYIALARAEEGRCLRQFPGYAAYMQRTGRFLPARFSLNIAVRFGDSRLARVAGWALSYVSVLGLALVLAFGIRVHTLNALHTHQTDEGVYVSVVEMTDEDLAAVATLARSAPEAQAAVGQNAAAELRRADGDVYFGDSDVSAARTGLRTCRSVRPQPRSLQGHLHPSRFRRRGTAPRRRHPLAGGQQEAAGGGPRGPEGQDRQRDLPATGRAVL
ncbi:MAG: isoprenylcysteine carboxylmethyltransferase family protein [Desulfurellaceae bacterium]|nr:isoprenylcysteine carboxylmethyltransferase family protein [Desulfurellaceae bacterium]